MMKFYQQLRLAVSRQPPREWKLNEYQQAFEHEIAKQVAQGSADLSTLSSVVAETVAKVIPESAVQILDTLKRSAPKMLREQDKFNLGFQKRSYKRWKEGFDLLKMMLVMSDEVGGTYNAVHRPAAVESDDAQFEAIVNLHARALRVSEEMYSLLRAGFPDGALSRWRTLHELAVIMTFLRKCEPLIAERFVLHRDVMVYKAIIQYREHQDRAKLAPISESEFEEARATANLIIEKHGQEMKTDYGWAAPALNNKRPTLHSLEKYVELDHWRPRFKWACNEIHGAYAPCGTSLGASECKEPALLTGPSNSGFTDPAHMLAISLNVANAALLMKDPTVDVSIIMSALLVLSDEIGQSFIAVEMET